LPRILAPTTTTQFGYKFLCLSLIFSLLTKSTVNVFHWTDTIIGSPTSASTLVEVADLDAPVIVVTNHSQHEHHHQGISDIHSAGLWIYVSSWEEGMSSWRKSVVEVLIVALRLNATMVEPCIRRGMLLNCDALQPGDAVIKLRDIFKMRRFEKKVRFVSDEVFRQVKDATPDHHHVAMCMHYGTPTDVCEFTSRSKLKHLPELEAAVNATRIHYNNNKIMSILEVTNFRRESFFYTIHNGTKLVRRKEVEGSLKLDFRKEHYDRVSNYLKQANIPEDKFSAIQWRGELVGMDYLGCASAILQARDAMSNHTGLDKQHFILISSLNVRPELQWLVLKNKLNSSATEAEDSRKALQLLLDYGFYKLDQFVEKDTALVVGDGLRDDSTFRMVWDMILAKKARAMATCFGCNDICSKCNWQGLSAQYTLDIRRDGEVDQSTWHCWPQ
jgi:hypothetical protein